MSANRFSGFSASVVSSGPTTTNFTQLRSVGIDPATALSEHLPAGALDRSAAVMSHADPTVRVVTADLSKVFGIVSLTAGLNCTGGGTFRWQKRADQSTWATGTSHETHTSSKGFLYVDSLSAVQDDVNGAAASLVYVPLYDGSTKPLVANSGVDFAAAPAPAFNSVYFMGPVYYDGGQLEGVSSWSYGNALNFSTFRGDGDTYRRIGSIVSRTPLVSITGRNLTWLSDTLGTIHAYNGNETLDLYLAKGAAGTPGRETYGSSAHIKISISASTIVPQSISVSDNDDATTTISFVPLATPALSLTSTIP